jgi:hypothetical protein
VAGRGIVCDSTASNPTNAKSAKVRVHGEIAEAAEENRKHHTLNVFLCVLCVLCG